MSNRHGMSITLVDSGKYSRNYLKCFIGTINNLQVIALELRTFNPLPKTTFKCHTEYFRLSKLFRQSRQSAAVSGTATGILNVSPKVYRRQSSQWSNA